MKPMRLQLLRRRGWRIPRNAVKVDRTTHFGNVREYGLELSLRLFEDTARGAWLPANVGDIDEPTSETLY